MKDWSAYERPTYTIARIIRFWCEIPDDTPLAVDRKKRIPVSDPSNPLIEARTAILLDALDRFQLPIQSADKDWNIDRDGIPPWSKTVIRHDALKRWFERYRPYERPAFLFWREGEQQSAEVIEAVPAPAENQDQAPKAQQPEPSPVEQAGDTPGRQCGGGVTVALPHMNPALEVIFAIMWDHWGEWDQRHRPKQGNIQADIDAAMGWKPESDGNPSRNAKAIAAILKPDAAPYKSSH